MDLTEKDAFCKHCLFTEYLFYKRRADAYQFAFQKTDNMRKFLAESWRGFLDEEIAIQLKDVYDQEPTYEAIKTILLIRRKRKYSLSLPGQYSPHEMFIREIQQSADICVDRILGLILKGVAEDAN